MDQATLATLRGGISGSPSSPASSVAVVVSTWFGLGDGLYIGRHVA